MPRKKLLLGLKAMGSLLAAAAVTVAVAAALLWALAFQPGTPH